MRHFSLLMSAVVAVLTQVPAGAEEAHTTRILTEPVYGAVVTLEHGVNVYRPVPPTTHLIIDSGDAATVILGSGTRHIITGNAAAGTPTGR
jgi:hypothetical protein